MRRRDWKRREKMKERKEKRKKEEERRTKEEAKKKREDDTKLFSSSTPLSLAGLATDDDDQTYLISSLKKLIQKNRTVKIL